MLNLSSVSKVYVQGGRDIKVLDNCSLSINSGDFVVIMGDSGSGKSTLLNLVAGIDLPSSGEITLYGNRIDKMSDKELTLFRRDNIGIVFQFFNLLPSLSALDNVALPLLLQGFYYKAAVIKATSLLDFVGLSDRLEFKVDELSGGQMQRVSIARALVSDPKLLLADEPTGNLDKSNTEDILSLFSSLSKDMDTTILFVTHSREIASSIGDRLIFLKDSTLEEVNDAKIF